jgi:hypothetical protein
MNLAIGTDSDRCPVGQPVALVDVDTNILIGCFASVSDAAKTRDMLVSAEYDAMGMSDEQYRRVAAEMDRLADDDEDGWEPGDDPDDWDGFGEGPSGAL